MRCASSTLLDDRMFPLKETTLAALVTIALLADAVVARCDPTLRCRNGGTLDQNVCQCSCTSGYHGRNCEVLTSTICRGSTDCYEGYHCMEANQYAGYMCTCKTGRCGWDCEREDAGMQRECNPNPCLNGGYCSGQLEFVESSDGLREACVSMCKCKLGFGGKNCEIADPCRTNPCRQSNLAECFETPLARSGRICSILNSYGGTEYVYEEDD